MMNVYRTKWQVTTLLLCTYGLLKEFRLTEPIHYQYHQDALNTSQRIFDVDVHPILTYSCLLTLIPVLLFADLLLYKPLITLEALVYIAAWNLIVFSGPLCLQQIVDSLHGWAAAAEIAYFAYIYVNVPKEKFKRVTSFTRGALLLGRFLACSLALLFILLEWEEFHTFNVISLVALCLSLFFANILPPVSWKLVYENRLYLLELKPTRTASGRQSYNELAKLHIKSIFYDTEKICENKFMMMWLASWILSNCAYSQVDNYTRILWSLSTVEHSQLYDGIAKALCSLIGLLVVLVVLYVPVKWSKYGQLCIGSIFLSDALILLLLSHTKSVVIIYCGYAAYNALYYAMVTIAQLNIVEGPELTSYGFVFGSITFVGLSFQSILTIVIAFLFDLTPVTMPQVTLEVYSGYHFAVAGIFIAPPLYQALRVFWRERGKLMLAFSSSRRALIVLWNGREKYEVDKIVLAVKRQMFSTSASRFRRFRQSKNAKLVDSEEKEDVFA